MMRTWKKFLSTGVLAAMSAGPLWAGGAGDAQAEISAQLPDEAAPVAVHKPKKAEKPWYVPDFTWFDLNLNYLDWTDGTVDRGGGAYDDFWYAELEGGAGWSWGDFYFFTDWENPDERFDADDAPDDSRWVIKPILDIDIPGTEGAMKNVQIHIQDYYLYGDGFLVNNLVVGFAYKYLADNFFARPFVGLHYVHDTFHESMWNGYMGGWVFNYDFTAFERKFSISNWHEFEWERDESMYLNDDGSRQAFGDASSWGVQGALTAWWHVTKHVTGGIQYRYAWHKLGNYNYLNGLIYTLKYNF